jgi:hypothetical protein
VRVRAAFYNLQALAYVVDLEAGVRVIVGREVAGDEYRDEDIQADHSVPLERAERILRRGLFGVRGDLNDRCEAKTLDEREIAAVRERAIERGLMHPEEVIVRGADRMLYLARRERDGTYDTVGVFQFFSDPHPCGWLRVPMYAVNRWPEVVPWWEVD